MTTKRRFSVLKLLILLAEVVILALALLYVAEYFDLPFVREAGGRAV